VKLDGVVRALVECKAAGIRGLVDKHIEQAENYASRAGICWVLLTNGVEWRLFHLSFAEGEGITHELAFEANLVEEIESNPDGLWGKLSLLSREAVKDDQLDTYWSQKKALSPAAVIRVLFTQDVLMAVRRELNRKSPARLDIEDVFNAVRDVLSKEALLEAGDIGIRKSRKRRRRRKVTTTDAATGQTVTEEIVEEEGDDDGADAGQGDGRPPTEPP
jgi:hypothetical protein